MRFLKLFTHCLDEWHQECQDDLLSFLPDGTYWDARAACTGIVGLCEYMCGCIGLVTTVPPDISAKTWWRTFLVFNEINVVLHTTQR